MVLYVAGAEVPKDYQSRHIYKNLSVTYWNHRNYLMEFLEFVETFGVSAARIVEKMNTNHQKIKQAELQYIQLDFPTGASLIGEAIDYNKDQEAAAERLRKQALMWAWIIEYFSIAGTLMLGVSMIYTLMVKRRFYKTQKSTRMRR
jgi:hypothetical protein